MLISFMLELCSVEHLHKHPLGCGSRHFYVQLAKREDLTSTFTTNIICPTSLEVWVGTHLKVNLEAFDDSGEHSLHKLWLYSWWFCCLKLQIWCFIFRLYWVSEVKLAYWIHANKNFCQVCFGLQESCNSILGPSVKLFRQSCTFHSRR